MTEGQLKKLQKDVDLAGSAADTTRTLRSAITTIENDTERVEHAKNAHRQVFAGRLAAWWSMPVDPKQIPFTIGHDIRRALSHVLSGYACVTLESFLAAWIFQNRLHQPPAYGMGIAILCAVLVHGAFLMLYRNPQRPKQEFDQIKTHLLKPALWLFALAAVLLVLGRTLRGAAALMMANALNVSLTLSTIGLIAMAGALFAGASILRWSRHDDLEYQALGAEEARNNAYKKSFEDQLTKLAEMPPLNTSVAPEEQSKAPPIAGGAAAAMMVALILVPFAMSCSSPALVVKANDDGIERELVVSEDYSGSPHDSAYATSTRSLRSHLPMVIEKNHFVRLQALHFGSDGWIPDVVLDMPLPKQKVVQVVANDIGEAGELGNVREALDEETAEQTARAERSAKEAYRQQLLPALAAVTDEVLVPPAHYAGSKYTDLNGHLQYIRNLRSDRSIVVLLFTDGGENLAPTLETVPRPEGNVSLAIILMPEKIEQLKSPQPQNGRTQYETRAPRIAAAVPWAVVVPYFNQNWNTTIAAALDKK